MDLRAPIARARASKTQPTRGRSRRAPSAPAEKRAHTRCIGLHACDCSRARTHALQSKGTRPNPRRRGEPFTVTSPRQS
eukprot:1563275-Pleurochrysis_carterae.AAC.1